VRIRLYSVDINHPSTRESLGSIPNTAPALFNHFLGFDRKRSKGIVGTLS
ncbi:unnamed protein product, partial [marine sediment metagenome]